MFRRGGYGARDGVWVAVGGVALKVLDARVAHEDRGGRDDVPGAAAHLERAPRRVVY